MYLTRHSLTLHHNNNNILLPNLDSSISTTTPSPPIFSELLITISSATSRQKLAQSMGVPWAIQKNNNKSLLN